MTESVDQALILQPFFGVMLLTLVVWIYMYVRRLGFIFSNRLDPARMTPSELAQRSPPAVSAPSDNLKNLFEMPTVFYAVVLCLYATRHVDALHLAAAWTFVAFRVLHSAVHCTSNYIPLRFSLYVLSSAALWLMFARAAFAAFA